MIKNQEKFTDSNTNDKNYIVHPTDLDSINRIVDSSGACGIGSNGTDDDEDDLLKEDVIASWDIFNDYEKF